MIPLAIVIGIIEDKIANDLTSKDTKARECLEDVKAKMLKHKMRTRVVFDFKDSDTFKEYVVSEVQIENGFVMTRIRETKTYYNTDLINRVEVVNETDTEDEYVEGTTRGLVDL